MKVGQKLAVEYLRTRLKLTALVSIEKAAQKAFELFCTPAANKLKKVPEIFERAEKLNITLEGKRVTGYRWNHPRPKKFLILHGFTSAARYFDHYVSPMLKKGYEVLAFDAPAHGDSEGRQTNVLQYRNMIEEVFRAFGPIDAFMGHSFGGLAVALALENISHTPGTRLVLVAPATETKTAINSFFSFMQLSPEVRTEFDLLIEKLGGQPVSWYSVARAIKNIQATTLWIHDEDDDVTPLQDVQTIIEAGYPNIQFLITRGWGHRRIYRENKVVKAVTAFL